VDDFDGFPVIYVFVCGELYARINPDGDWEYDLIAPTSTVACETISGVLYNLGEIGEETYEEFTSQLSLDFEVTLQAFYTLAEQSQGHEVVAFIGRVCQAVFERFEADDPGYLTEPKGF
jgi:hypothetical protein